MTSIKGELVNLGRNQTPHSILQRTLAGSESADLRMTSPVRKEGIQGQYRKQRSAGQADKHGGILARNLRARGKLSDFEGESCSAASLDHIDRLECPRRDMCKSAADASPHVRVALARFAFEVATFTEGPRLASVELVIEGLEMDRQSTSYIAQDAHGNHREDYL